MRMIVLRRKNNMFGHFKLVVICFALFGFVLLYGYVKSGTKKTQEPDEKKSESSTKKEQDEE